MELNLVYMDRVYTQPGVYYSPHFHLPDNRIFGDTVHKLTAIQQKQKPIETVSLYINGNVTDLLRFAFFISFNNA